MNLRNADEPRPLIHPQKVREVQWVRNIGFCHQDSVSLLHTGYLDKQETLGRSWFDVGPAPWKSTSAQNLVFGEPAFGNGDFAP